MKYIIVKDDFGTEQPLVSSEILGHKDMAGHKPVVSAGFCGFNAEGHYVTASVWGDSTTLNVKSRPEDAALLERMLRS